MLRHFSAYRPPATYPEKAGLSLLGLHPQVSREEKQWPPLTSQQSTCSTTPPFSQSLYSLRYNTIASLTWRKIWNGSSPMWGRQSLTSMTNCLTASWWALCAKGATALYSRPTHRTTQSCRTGILWGSQCCFFPARTGIRSLSELATTSTTTTKTRRCARTRLSSLSLKSCGASCWQISPASQSSLWTWTRHPAQPQRMSS
mmetsp:Transcript_28240/g.79722  ORF Transcript_28240/g.79722 Transcript_28240/m.79722 type:complete len:201 (-) Transcript_28240:1252-1854(-)